MKVRDVFDAIWPVTRRQFKRVTTDATEKTIQMEKEINRLINLTNEILSYMNEEQKRQAENHELIIKILDKNQTDFRENHKEIKNEIEKISENVQTQNKINNQIINMLRMNKRFNEENVWANVFHDATNQTEWMKKSNFTPGRWAIGYQTLYVLYRVLNEIQPQSILELGLGESTKMITQYVDTHKEVIHKVVEHDENWIKIFKDRTVLSERTDIIVKKLSTDGTMNGINDIRIYDDFSEVIMPATYDLIVIDAPWGGDMKEYARIDIAGIMPGCLKKSFVILVDDYNRIGEQKMVGYMKKLLEDNGVEYAMAKYEGAKDLAVITSKDLGFVCTL